MYKQHDYYNLNFVDFLQSARRNHLQFNDESLDERFVPYFRTGDRVKVAWLGRVYTGYVSVSTGYNPVFILLARSNSISLSIILNLDVELIAVKPSGSNKYHNV